MEIQKQAFTRNEVDRIVSKVQSNYNRKIEGYRKVLIAELAIMVVIGFIAIIFISKGW